MQWGSKVRKLRDRDDGCPLSGRPDMGTVYPASCEPSTSAAIHSNR